jgi:hypothetical protein
MDVDYLLCLFLEAGGHTKGAQRPLCSDTRGMRMGKGGRWMEAEAGIRQAGISTMAF